MIFLDLTSRVKVFIWSFMSRRRIYIYIYIYLFTLFLFYLNFFFSVYILIFFPSCRSPISTIALLNFQSYSIKLTLL